MQITARQTSDPIAQAIAWITSRGVQVERRTTCHIDLDHAPPDRPVLYLIEPGVLAPMAWTELEDWVRLPTDASELFDRADRLLARAVHAGTAHVWVDDDDILRVGERLVPLSPLESNLMRLLLEEPGALVPRHRLETELWPAGTPPETRALDNRVKRLRHHLRGLPLRIHTVRGRGFLIEQAPMSPAEPIDGVA